MEIFEILLGIVDASESPKGCLALVIFIGVIIGIIIGIVYLLNR